MFILTSKKISFETIPENSVVFVFTCISLEFYHRFILNILSEFFFGLSKNKSRFNGTKF